MIKETRFNKGMTFIELIVGISVFTITIVLIFSTIIFFYRTNKYSIDQAFAIESARKGVEFMIRDIKEITYSDEGSYPVIDAGLDFFYFYSDTDRDMNIERIKFFLDGNNFKKTVTKSIGNPLTYDDINSNTIIVSDNVRNTEQGVDIFTYFDSNGDQIFDLNNITDIAFVKVNLIVNADRNRSPGEFNLRSSATLRNLKINL